MQIDIRVGQKTDAAQIAELSRSTFYETFAPFNRKEDMDYFMDHQFTTEGLIHEVEEGSCHYFLAFDAGLLVGYACMREKHYPESLKWATAIEISRIYVKKSCKGKGVGGMLIQHCIDYALQCRKEVVWLGVWEKNETAIGFYERYGFEKFDEHDFLLGHDLQRDWLMMKKLNF